MKIYATDAESCFVDITEAVQALYDLAMMGNGYGSGFWSYEDAAPVLKLAKLMDWDADDELQKYADEKLFLTERAAYLSDNDLNAEKCVEGRQERLPVLGGYQLVTRWRVKKHDHAYSTTGQCMWYSCDAKEQDVPRR